MQESKASETAKGVALLRVLHQKVDGKPTILHDPVSERLLDPSAVSWAMDHLDRFETPHARGLRVHVVVRSRYGEDALAEAQACGVCQLVVLGAGLDTFAYRQPRWAQALHIFETDHPASQEDKHRRLASASVHVPENLTYAPVDFERESLSEGLHRAGLDFAQPTFFSCLGVLMYLTQGAIDDLFAFLGSFPKHSEVVLSFLPQRDRTEGSSRMEERVAAVGEPLRSCFSEDALTAKLGKAGFPGVLFPTTEEIGTRYMQDRTDGLQPPRHKTLARARL
jgi:methyltransferase (TIGR00027 family)